MFDGEGQCKVDWLLEWRNTSLKRFDPVCYYGNCPWVVQMRMRMVMMMVIWPQAVVLYPSHSQHPHSRSPPGLGHLPWGDDNQVRKACNRNEEQDLVCLAPRARSHDI